MCRAIAAKVGEMDRGSDTAPLPGLAHRVTGFVGDCSNAKALSAELKHLWHKEHSVRTAVLIQRRQDVLLAAHFHKIAGVILR
jgi:hypothetical protein